MMVRENSASDREPAILRFNYHARNFVPQHMGNLFIHVPLHQFARAKTARFGLYQQSPRRAGGNVGVLNLYLSTPDVPCQFHPVSFWAN
jgi:hypothetical protein